MHRRLTNILSFKKTRPIAYCYSYTKVRPPDGHLTKEIGRIGEEA